MNILIILVHLFLGYPLVLSLYSRNKLSHIRPWTMGGGLGKKGERVGEDKVKNLPRFPVDSQCSCSKFSRLWIEHASCQKTMTCPPTTQSGFPASHWSWADQLADKGEGQGAGVTSPPRTGPTGSSNEQTPIRRVYRRESHSFSCSLALDHLTFNRRKWPNFDLDWGTQTLKQ